MSMDDHDQASRADRRLETGPWTFSTVLASHQELSLGERIKLAPLNGDAFAALLRGAFDRELDAARWKGCGLRPVAIRGWPACRALIGQDAPDVGMWQVDTLFVVTTAQRPRVLVAQMEREEKSNGACGEHHSATRQLNLRRGDVAPRLMKAPAEA